MDVQRRLGLIVPSSNTAAERDFRRLMPAEVAVHSARMYLAETTAAAERVMLDDHAPQAAKDLGTLKPELVVFSCTSAGALLGIDGERQLEANLNAWSGAEVVSTNAAVAARLTALGLRRIAVVTAYVDELNREIEATLRGRGLDVAVIRGMGITDNYSIALVSPDEIAEFAAQSVAGVDADGVFISCTNLRAAEAADELAQRLGKPVVTSNLAAADEALRRMGLPTTGVGMP
jgi:maleate isomerase